ncbi:MAG TPA: GTP cyclohydrolase I [Candidatus Acidoferrales bacterium]|nr:GTP cyclohydrolase I [Candidatus Acidoferrales bacterium]
MSDGPPGSDTAAVERAVAALIDALGLARSDGELAGTPARVAGLYRELLAGLDPAQAPSPITFPLEGPGQLVIVRDLAFHSLCVHHFLPFFGRATIAYLPGDRIFGISAAARLLDHYARRPQLQERIGEQIADHLERLVRPRGVAVLLEARHLCMEMRGVRRYGLVETRVVRGACADPAWAGALQFGADPGR